MQNLFIDIFVASCGIYDFANDIPGQEGYQRRKPKQDFVYVPIQIEIASIANKKKITGVGSNIAKWNSEGVNKGKLKIRFNAHGDEKPGEEGLWMENNHTLPSDIAGWLVKNNLKHSRKDTSTLIISLFSCHGAVRTAPQLKDELNALGVSNFRITASPHIMENNGGRPFAHKTRKMRWLCGLLEYTETRIERWNVLDRSKVVVKG